MRKVKPLFSERYENLIENSTFICQLERLATLALIEILNEFNEPVSEQAGRYDGYIVNSDTHTKALEEYFQFRDWQQSDISFCDDEWFFSLTMAGLFDILEIWYNQLSLPEKVPFQDSICNVFAEYRYPWILVGGKVIKIDLTQFEQDLQRNSIEEFKQLSCEISAFQNADNEFLKAQEKLQHGSFDEAILYAEKSYESTLKIICNQNEGTADNLTNLFMNEKCMKDLPLPLKTAFRDKILMTLPYIRNKLPTSHGMGSSNYEIPGDIAQLSINLAATLNTYLIAQYRQGLSANYVGEKKSDI